MMLESCLVAQEHMVDLRITVHVPEEVQPHQTSHGVSLKVSGAIIVF